MSQLLHFAAHSLLMVWEEQTLANQVGGLNEARGSFLQPGPGPAVVAIQEVNQWMEVLSLSLPMTVQINK